MTRRWLALLAAVARRPTLWPVALRQGARLVPRGWWRTRPFLPLPDRGYLAFRLQTMYGGDGRPSQMEPADVLRWLEWAAD